MPVPDMRTPLHELTALLGDLFEVDELRRFVMLRFREGRQLASELPSGTVPLANLCLETALLLIRRGHVGAEDGMEDLFALLEEERPSRVKEIRKVQGRFLQPAEDRTHWEKGRPGLPHPPAKVLPRQAEVVAVLALFAGGARLVVLTGPYGQGKSTLAALVGICWRARTQEAEVVYADLKGCADLSAFVEALEIAVGVRGSHVQDVTGRLHNVETALSSLGEVLLVLDQLDDLTEIARDPVSGLLKRLPRLSVLGTSRKALSLPVEHRYRVPGLNDQECLTLFEMRAQMVFPVLALTAAEREAVVCIGRSLHGSPKALEIAAAESSLLPPSRILTELERIVVGADDLRAFLDWVWSRRDADERRVLTRCSTFASGFSLAAAESLASGRGASVAEVLGRLERLSLITPVPVQDAPTARRFLMFDGIRLYARRRVRSPELWLHSANVTLREGLQLAADVRSARFREALELLEHELGNLEDVFERSAEVRPADAIRALLALVPHRMARGPAHVLIDLVERLGRLDHPTIPPDLRASAILARCDALQLTGRAIEAEPDARDALQIAKAHGLEVLRGHALAIRAWCARERGAIDEAIEHGEAGVACLEQVGDAHASCSANIDLGSILYAANRLRDGERRYRIALELARGAGDVPQEARCLRCLAVVERNLGRFAEARQHLERALVIEERIGRFYAVAMCQYTLGNLLLDEEDLDAAERAFSQAAGLYKGWDDAFNWGTAELGLGHVAFDRGNLREAERRYEDLASRLHQKGGRWLEALALIYLGYCRVRLADPDGAASPLETARALSAAVGDRRLQRSAAIVSALRLLLVNELVEAEVHFEEASRLVPRGEDPLEDFALDLFRACLYLALSKRCRENSKEDEALRLESRGQEARARFLDAVQGGARLNRSLRLAIATFEEWRRRVAQR